MNSENDDAMFARWLDEVQILSSNAPLDVLQRHLDRVTDLSPPDVRFLRKHLAMRKAGPRVSPATGSHVSRPVPKD